MWHLMPLAIAAFFLNPPPRLLRLAVSLAGASVVLWALAHLLLYTLYLPARFGSYGLLLAAVLLAGHTLGSIADRVRFGPLLVAALLLAWPAYKLARSPYPIFAIKGPSAPLLQSRIANSSGHGPVGGLARDLDFVTAATGRPILWSWETALPYKLRYRAEVVRQLNSAGEAVLAARPEPFLKWVRLNAIDLVMVDEDVFRLGGAAPLVAATPGGSTLARRFPGRPDSWLARQDNCVLRQNHVLLYSVPCILGAAAISRDIEKAAAAP
jgi:hypothetical protein